MCAQPWIPNTKFANTNWHHKNQHPPVKLKFGLQLVRMRKYVQLYYPVCPFVRGFHAPQATRMFQNFQLHLASQLNMLFSDTHPLFNFFVCLNLVVVIVYHYHICLFYQVYAGVSEYSIEELRAIKWRQEKEKREAQREIQRLEKGTDRWSYDCLRCAFSEIWLFLVICIMSCTIISLLSFSVTVMFELILNLTSLYWYSEVVFACCCLPKIT